MASLAPRPDPAKKKAPKVKAADPYGALPMIGGLTVSQIQRMTPQQIEQYRALYQAQGPNYSQVPRVDFGALQQAAWKQSGVQTAEQAAPYQAERDRLAKQLDTSRGAATNFAAAFAQIAGGGNTSIDDPAAQRYALENWGGSYVGGMAASLGAQLIAQLSSQFGAQDAKYAAQIKDIMDQRPDIAESIYKQVADDAAAQIKEGRSLAEMSYKNQLGALASLAKAMGGTEADVSYVTQPGGAVVGFDKRTGKVVYTIAGSGGMSGAGSGSSSSGGSSSRGSSSPQAGSSVSPYTTSVTVARATKAGEAALGSVLDKVAASAVNGMGEDGARKALPGLLTKSFGSAMYRVIVAIAPHLKALGYSQAQVKRAAFEIVSAKISPPKGYKPPKATPVSYREAALPGSQYANYTGKTPSDAAVYQMYKDSGPMNDAQLLQVLQQAGFTGQGLQIAYSIAKRESGANPLAFNPNASTGDRSWGLFQINTLGSMKSRVKQFGLKSEMQLLDPVTNARAAYRMSNGGTDFGAWGYGPNAYRDVPLQILTLPGTT